MKMTDERMMEVSMSTKSQTFPGSLPLGRGNNPASKEKHLSTICSKERLFLLASGYLTIIELTMWLARCVWQPTPITADVTDTKIAGYVRVCILMNR